jgi:hypothetical protein
LPHFLFMIPVGSKSAVTVLWIWLAILQAVCLFNLTTLLSCPPYPLGHRYELTQCHIVHRHQIWEHIYRVASRPETINYIRCIHFLILVWQHIENHCVMKVLL